MDNLMNTVTQTPIEIALSLDENGMTTAKKLYDFLGMDVRNYSRWARNNIIENQFAEENVDYWAFVINDERNYNPNPTQDYKLSASFAKKLSMMSKSEKGEQARQYFIRVEDRMKEVAFRLQNISPELQAIIMHDKKIQQVDGKVDSINQDLQEFKRDMPILGIEEDRITQAVRKKGVQCLGGKDSNAYKDRSLRGKLYSDLYQQLYRQFGISTYKAIKRNQCDLAISVIEQYAPPFILKERIQDCNAQMNMEVA